MADIEVTALLNNVSLIIEYFVPGYIFLFIFCKLMDFEEIKNTSCLLGSVVISYILRNVLELICFWLFPKKAVVISLRAILLVLASVILSIILAQLLKVRSIQKLWHIVFKKGLHNSLLADNVGTSDTTVKIVSDNGKTEYFGQIAYYEDNGLESWIVLKKCIITEDGQKQTEDYPDIISTVAVNMKNIDRIIFYNSQ